MRLVRFLNDCGSPSIGVLEETSIADVTATLPELGGDTLPLIASWSEYRSGLEQLRGRRDYDLGNVHLLAPVGRPGKIWGLGFNYPSHFDEASDIDNLPPPVTGVQTWFAMAQTTVAGPYDAVELPVVSSQLDYEVELVMVIGAGGRNIPEGRAADTIFGYCAGNDFSVRDWQVRSGQFSIGKSFDTHAPFGPCIVTADEIDASALSIRSFVNGERRQAANTREMMHSPAALVAHLSQAMTLEPGDVFFTGTPTGIGLTMKPPRYLVPGDVVRVEIDGIGHLENRVAAAV